MQKPWYDYELRSRISWIRTEAIVSWSGAVLCVTGVTHTVGRADTESRANEETFFPRDWTELVNRQSQM